MEGNRMITISLSKYNQATVWNKDDVIHLRKQHRIIGNLVGSLPRKPWQNQVMSLPLLLMPEEVTLLVRKGYATLKQESMFPPTPTYDIIRDFKELRDKSHSEQIRIFVKDRESKKKIHDKRVKPASLNQDPTPVETSSTERIGEGSDASPGIDSKNVMKTERESKCKLDFDKEDSCNKSHRSESLAYIKAKDEEYSKKDEEDCEIDENDVKYYSKSTWVHIPTASTQCLKCLTKSKPPFPDWHFPSTEKEKLSYSVYCDLWEKGYYISTGEKFGCDFLVYPGEPSRFHSHFIVMIMPSTRQLSAMELLAYGRLGTGVKKTVVLAIVDMAKDYSVHYQSLSWTGNDGLN